MCLFGGGYDIKFGLRDCIMVCYSYVKEESIDIIFLEIFLSVSFYVIKFNFFLKLNLLFSVNIFFV